MKSLDEKREKLAEKYSSLSGPEYTVFIMQIDFKNGWDACAREYDTILEDTKLKIESDFRKEIAELKEEIKMWKLWHESLKASIRNVQKKN